VVTSATGEPSKLKVKVRVTNHGVFGIMNAYIVEKTIVEEPVVEIAPATVPTNSQTETQDEAKKQTGEQPSQDSDETKEQQGASSSDEPTSKGDSQDSTNTPSTEPGQQQSEEAMDIGNTTEQGQPQPVSEKFFSI